MTIQEIGKKVVALVREGKFTEAIETLYDPAVVSVEAGGPPGANREEAGIAACIAKGKQWLAEHEIHAARVNGPFPHGDRFAVFMSFDLTQRASGKRFTMEEVGLYTVRNGKIVREEFFYDM